MKAGSAAKRPIAAVSSRDCAIGWSIAYESPNRTRASADVWAIVCWRTAQLHKRARERIRLGDSMRCPAMIEHAGHPFPPNPPRRRRHLAFIGTAATPPTPRVHLDKPRRELVSPTEPRRRRVSPTKPRRGLVSSTGAASPPLTSLGRSGRSQVSRGRSGGTVLHPRFQVRNFPKQPGSCWVLPRFGFADRIATTAKTKRIRN